MTSLQGDIIALETLCSDALAFMVNSVVHLGGKEHHCMTSLGGGGLVPVASWLGSRELPGKVGASPPDLGTNGTLSALIPISCSHSDWHLFLTFLPPPYLFVPSSFVGNCLLSVSCHKMRKASFAEHLPFPSTEFKDKHHLGNFGEGGSGYFLNKMTPNCKGASAACPIKPPYVSSRSAKGFNSVGFWIICTWPSNLQCCGPAPKKRRGKEKKTAIPASLPHILPGLHQTGPVLARSLPSWSGQDSCNLGAPISRLDGTQLVGFNWKWNMSLLRAFREWKKKKTRTSNDGKRPDMKKNTEYLGIQELYYWPEPEISMCFFWLGSFIMHTYNCSLQPLQGYLWWPSHS